jgi:outer membrane lipoprotein carrier protein
MRKLLAYIFLWLPATQTITLAQNAVSKSEQERIISEISTSAHSIRTLQCKFEQTKELSIMDDKMVSKGTMAFARPGNLSWHYTSPYDYNFIIANDKVHIGKGKSHKSIDLKSSQTFQGIAKMIAGSVTGKCLTQTKDFDVKIRANERVYVAHLTPKDKHFKKMFTTIRLTYNRANRTMDSVEMTEANGDVTSIVFKEIKQNQPLGENVFNLD